jgi:hypothetical protein
MIIDLCWCIKAFTYAVDNIDKKVLGSIYIVDF